MAVIVITLEIMAPKGLVKRVCVCVYKITTSNTPTIQ